MEKCKNPKCTCKPCNCSKDGGVCVCGLDEYEKTTIENLVLDLTAAKKLAEDNLNLAKYQKAEFENYKKRERTGMEAAFNDGRSYAIISFMPVVDALAEAIKVVKGAEERKGLEILQRKFESILSGFGVTEVDAKVGGKFDPYVHNSVAVGQDSTKPSGCILEVWQKGYKLEGKVIRASSVKVNQ